MRLESFGVTGYGIFGDFDLDLSAPGLHVLFGPNGAGKSTLARAMADLFYGVPERTPYAFRTPPGKLRVRATVADTGSKRMAVVRRKGRKNTLLRPDGTPIAEDEFLPFLAGVSRESYESAFVLTQHQLREAGHALARGEGRLGELLFHAQGVQAPVTVLQEIAERKDAIFRPRGKVPDLNKATHDYHDLRTKVHESTTPPRAYTELTNAFERTSAEVEALSQKLAEAAEQQRRWETVQSRRSDVERRRSVLRRLQDLPAQGGFVPLGAAAELDTIRVQRADARSEVDRINTELSQLNGRLDELAIDHTVLNHAAEITALSADRNSQSEKRQRLDELGEPVAEAQRRAETTRAAVSAIWSHDDARADVIPAGASETIADLCKQDVEHATEQTEVAQQIQRYQTEQANAQAKLDASPDILDPMDLEVAIERVRAADSPGRQLTKARGEASRAEVKARQELHDLGINEWDLEQLGTIVLPSRARINTLCRQADELDDRHRDLHKDIKQSRARRRKAQRDLDGLLLGNPPPTEEELEEARTRRDHDLEQLRSDCAVSPPHGAKRLTERVAGVHEAVTVTDGMADRMRREATKLAHRHQLVAAIETEDADIGVLESDTAAHAAQRAEWEEAWRTLWAATGISSTPAEATDVRSHLAKAREYAQTARERERRVDELTDEIEDLIAGLRRELDAMGDPAPPQHTLNELFTRAEQHLKRTRDHARERASVRGEADRASDELTSLRQRENACANKVQGWQHRWDRAVEEARLDRAATRPDNAEALLDARIDAHRAAVEFSKLDAEYTRLTRAVDDYRERACQLASTVDSELMSSDPFAIIDQFDQRLVKARQAQQTARLLHEQRDDVMQRRGLAEVAGHTASEQLAELLQRHAIVDEAALDASIERSRRHDEWQQQCSDLEDTLADSGIELNALEQLADEHDAATLTTRLEKLTDEVDILRRDKDTAIERLGEIRAGLQRHDGSAAAAQAQQAVQQQLATIGDLTEEYLRLHIAEHLLRNEIENYRAQRQDSVLALAETLFSRLTHGEYPHLEATFDDTDTPILLAHSTEDQARRVDQLNEGARDQLYLALRLATLQENSRDGQALPLILDDIFTSFDDQRTPVGLATLAELAEPIQIIVLTHHAAVANAARELPDATVSVHDLARAK